MSKLSPAQERAIELLKDAGGSLDYQIDLYAFGLPGAPRDKQVQMVTAKSLVASGIARASRTKPSRRGDLIDQIALVGKC
ncbi:hypothetical protein ACNPKZ_20155 [Shewanella algae]|uniref:hypothetical protein n=1 Tax=Shewanella algae TaxID=38313 RepID=UPI000B3495BF|nr:hypothetical protein [Shewanella algae]QXN27498.1 hypothetical protein KVP08_022680 [Shewanella putrefaciens]HDS1208411.1 hypothetical protein [Shewanella algae]